MKEGGVGEGRWGGENEIGKKTRWGVEDGNGEEAEEVRKVNQERSREGHNNVS